METPAFTKESFHIKVANYTRPGGIAHLAVPGQASVPEIPARLRDSPVLPLLAITAVAAGLRLALIDHQGYWQDEGQTVQLLHMSFGRMLDGLPRVESTPPLFYCLGWVWARVFGFDEAGLRSFSALLGVLTVPTLYLAGARMFSRRVGLIAAALAAFSPLLIWYSQEARPYALLLFLCALSLLMFERARVAPTPGRMLGWAVTAALAILAHYFAAMLVVPEAVWLLAVHRRRWVAWLAVAVVGAVGAALIPLAHSQRAQTQWITNSSLGVRLDQLRKQLLVGFGVPDPSLFWALAVAVVGAAIVLILWRADRRERARAATVAALAAGGFGLALVVKAAGSDFIDTRNLLELWLPLALLVAAGLGAVRVGAPGLAGAALLCGIFLAGTIYVESEPDLQRPDWRPVSNAMGPAPAAGDRVVVLLRYRSQFPIADYHPRLASMPPRRVEQVSEVDVISTERAPHLVPCWWGAACYLRAARLAAPPSLKGFREVDELVRGRFRLMRLRALRPQPETRHTIQKSLPAPVRYPDTLLLESAASGAAFLRAQKP